MPRSVPLEELVSYLDDYLRLPEVPDRPEALNGLQAESRAGAVTRIVAAVDASLATIEGVSTGPGENPLLLVHHGLFWDGNRPLTGPRYRRVRALLDRDIALYSAHIPLDVHPDVGNNHVLARALGLEDLEPFDKWQGIPVGVQGRLDPPVDREAFARTVEEHVGATAKLIPGGPAACTRVGIITGGAGGQIRAAKEAGLDTFVTGEGTHPTYFDAMELGVNTIFAGHYATETVGVKALAEHLSDRFGIPWEFHDHPTGL
ncbi:MAG: Nif3-like dinuclear metal center hexameric protein [Gemmatimonadales bacterium]